MMFSRVLCLSLLSLITACSAKENGPKTEPPSAAAQKDALATDPGPAIDVDTAKANGPADKVIVEGRVCDITKGFAVMKLMDGKLDYCGEINKEDNCPTPWDYCCDSKDERVAHSLLVEVRDAAGKPLATPSLPKMRLVDKVKVTGKIIKDEHGNLVLLADGLYHVERPSLPDYIKWPE